MKKINQTIILLLLIILLSFGLRIWQISSVPPGLTWDEATLGYNAYSIIKTGGDEYGSLLPLTLKSFGDYKPAVYVYLDIPFVYILGLNELAVRLPSVVMGTLLVLLIYLFMVEIFNNRLLGLSCSLMLSISPFAVQFSRPAFESNVAVTLNILGILFFIKGLKKNKWFILSAIFFSLSIFTYQASRLFVPMILLSLVILFWKYLMINKFTVMTVLILAVVALINGYLIFGAGQGGRLSTMNYFAYTRSSGTVKQLSKALGENVKDLKFQIIEGEWFSYIRGLFERYLIYFSPKMLFVDGDYNLRDRVPDLGTLYYFSLPLFFLGFIYLWKAKSDQKINSFIKLFFVLLFLAPIPAVLSRDLITEIRALNLVFPLAILEGAGLFWLIKYLLKYKSRYLYVGFSIIGFIMMANVVIYLDRYFVHMPKEYGQDWLARYKNVVLDMNSLVKNHQYNEIIFTDYYGQPYIYYLFYTLYPPQNFQSQAILDQPTVDVGTVRRIDNIFFKHVYLPDNRGLKNSLLIGTEMELPLSDIQTSQNLKLIKEYKFADGQVAFRIVRVE